MRFKLVLNKRKRQLFKKKEIKRVCLKIGLRLKYKFTLKSIIELGDLKRNSSLSKIQTRCFITGRSKAVYRKFGISRIKLREMILNGVQVGLKKSSW
ncbi:ribosomal protein S14 (mitochondrion) [Hemiselmis andersenii]|uniref:Ribosomal protein S14 n=1 Tax=Hemiselmis andersenii TaxID=464988 RepID=B2MWW1_HEMAN|nr:ribosomal protein S14 [Hemiselmis andersenii]ACC78253.1 ribosomal protein S14 [Hemiselmis andersenii]